MSTLPTVIKLARKLERAKSALQVIQTWASYKRGIALQAEHVEKLCRETLEKIKEKA